MKNVFQNVSRSWKLFALLMIAVPLLAYTMVSYFEKRYAALPYKGKNDEWFHSKQRAVPLMDFRFTDQKGNDFSSDRIDRKIVVAHFFFSSCPSICPEMFRHVKQIASAYAKDSNIIFLSFTVDPQHDIPAILNDYGNLYEIDPVQWKLLTGNKKEIYRLARKGFYVTATDGDGGPDDFIHSDRVMLMDKEKFIRGYYNGTSDKEIQLLINDIKKLENE